MIDESAVAKVEEHIADALRLGGGLVCGGKRHALGGTFFEPTIVRDATVGVPVGRVINKMRRNKSRRYI